ncbi:MAG: aldose 1-epimerase family protein [Clostridia bacterium]|nr:aldose 1-epimerase family protein [Clostridia bacterium]
MEYNLENGFLRLTFSSLGGELRSIINKKNGREYLWQGNPEFWTGRSPNLFPIVGRIKEGKYRFGGKEYSIKSPHGFVRISELDVKEKTDKSLTFAISSCEETLKVYPFDFDFEVSYTLEDNRIAVKYDIRNTGDKTMYFSVGAHPGFNIPINEGEKFEDYSIVFENDCEPNEVICENCYITGEKRPFSLKDKRILPLRHNLFDNDAIILADMKSRKLSVCSEKSDSSITVDFADFDYLGIWHKPMTEAPYVCIEPWNGLPSEVVSNEELTIKPAIIALDTGKEYLAAYAIEIM